jgi:hypothetical protein
MAGLQLRFSSGMSSKCEWEELSGGINYGGGWRVAAAFYRLGAAVDEQSEEWTLQPAALRL